MPTLDVSDAILDDDFVDEITVIRRPFTISDAGRTVITPKTVIAWGVVTQGTPENFQQEADAQTGKAMITAHAYDFQFYEVDTGRSKSYQPDVIVYLGQHYQVVKVYNWSRYGDGFTVAVAELYDMTEKANDR